MNEEKDKCCCTDGSHSHEHTHDGVTHTHEHSHEGEHDHNSCCTDESHTHNTCCEDDDCGCDDKNSSCCFEEDDMDIITLTLDDNTEMECGVLGIFEVEGTEYIALVSIETQDVYLYKYNELPGKADEFELLNTENDEEFKKVEAAFSREIGRASCRERV